MKKPVIEVCNLTTSYGDRIIHDRINFEIYKDESFAILGGSGSGKSTLLSAMILLNRPKSGEIKIFGRDICKMSAPEHAKIMQHCGVLFQFGALFSSLSVIENVSVVLEEYSNYPPSTIREIAKMWLDRVGLKPNAFHLYPCELSGGMKKRVGLARAMVLNPEILFLDEPTSGLDPLSVGRFDELISELKAANPFTVVIVTHDLDTVNYMTDRFLLLKEGKIEFQGTLKEFRQYAQENSLDKENLFNSTRGERFWKEM
ncbi:ABC transporter ATP-binding protein [Helicobacter mustelae]|uniref:Putative ABC transport system ATP-binding protein n=1 Tax=Helicobacter mustelae (strain ATCC 43772 / CCUG 25715 / CIP 103759 / LMG 18044 / NCTC 12198 / R85-136P) TaxID=679897 RepID=D3UJD5_HELM1|nr:ATP-binding cassette domain-containing protein [Helicobacter mustelae]CBG40611.1 putative ABC transport system ATP-binding protein [Helicobacter mustelae 12198]SQH72109.1 ABC transporter ATP-binding protein [Helicobacter mustelae]STP13252.1 ABC transporter ATP-binding protein [Helicobacter mustelae]